MVSQFLRFLKEQTLIENNPLEVIKIKRRYVVPSPWER